MCVTQVGLQAAGMALSAGQTVIGIQQANYQANVARRRAKITHINQQRQQDFENRKTINEHISAIRAQQSAEIAAHQDVLNASEAANRSYVQEQLKVLDAKKATAFKLQDIYSKQIGSKGSVFASGRVGRSVGLLALDAERKGGLATAKELASADSIYQQSEINQQNIETARQSKINIALSSIPNPVEAPQFAPEIMGDNPLGLGIPDYNFN
tara:strand:+ start:217 stop:852 length:636 start_codon:yes stop_codon:yes gene_type:complete